MLEEEIDSMISAHRAACRHHWIKPACLVFDKRNRLFNNITLISTVHFSAVMGMFPVRQPAFAIYAAQGKKLHLPCLNEPRAGFNHAEISIFIVRTA